MIAVQLYIGKTSFLTQPPTTTLTGYGWTPIVHCRLVIWTSTPRFSSRSASAAGQEEFGVQVEPLVQLVRSLLELLASARTFSTARASANGRPTTPDSKLATLARWWPTDDYGRIDSGH
jgi:hypothetical protein